MNNYPLITVYIPTFNRVDLLRRAVDSVLNQDYTNIEIIIVDDHSEDETANYLHEISIKEPRVRYFINETNLGACACRNKAIAEARGEFITGLDDDDYFLPNRISSFVFEWKYKSGNTIALFSDSFIKKNNGKTILTKRKKVVNKKCLYEMNHIGNQVFLPTKTLFEINGFDESLSSWQDYDCWFRLYKKPEDIMALAPSPTYVNDVSHDYERIGMISRNKKILSFEVIAKKHDLSGRCLDSMKVVLFESAHIAPSIGMIISKIIYSMSYSNIMFSLRVLIKSIIYSWPSSVSTDKE